MRTLWRPLAALGLALAWGLATPAQATEQIARTAAPDWVEAIEPPAPSRAPATNGSSQSTVYLLVDTQTRVEPGGRRQHFRHYAMQATDSRGVESAANVEIGFDPSYQTLALHRLRVHRDGQVQDRLRDAQIRVLQRERELETLIYDGSRTASIFLDDVRVGDVVEYAYSIEGNNPVFGGRHSGAFELQWSTPVAQLRTRLLWPSGRPLTLKTLPAERPVQSRALGAYTEHRISADAVPALRIESDAPGWYVAHAMLVWSEWQSWNDVVRWALPLYATPASLPPALLAERDRILREHADPADRAAAALRWVQREIRYLGIEVGANSHAPNPPATVIARRFGDCKDKTLLTITLLRALGLQAEPALVNTELRQAVQQGLPRPTAFNHVIVHLRLNSKSYWLDPTHSPQPGGLDDISQPGWGQALLVTPQTTALTAMEPAEASLSRRQVHLLLDGSRGVAAPATLTVTSELSGRSAESERAALANDGLERVQQRYLNFYARSYTGLRVAAPLEVQDDPEHNRLRVVEHYELGELLPFNADRRRREVSLVVPEVLSNLSYPQERVRSAPLAVGHPVELRHELEVRLPEAWTIKPETTEVSNAAFSLKREVLPIKQDNQTRVLRLVDHYRSLADHVDATAMAAYLGDIDKARDAVNYEIYQAAPAKTTGDSLGGAFNLPIALLGLFMLAGWVRLAQRVHRWDPAPAAGAPIYDGLPLGGLLLLLVLGQAIALIRDVVSLSKSVAAYEPHRWAELTVPGGAQYHPMLSSLLLAELAVMLGLIVGLALGLRLLWQRRSSAPRVVLAMAWGAAAWRLLDGWLGDLLLPGADGPALSIGSILVQLIVLLAWTWYLTRGTRSRDTFITRYQAPAPAADLATATPG